MDCAKMGDIIRTMRRERNLTQRQLADRLNISDKTVSKWERGLGCPDISLLKQLADVLGISLDRLLTGILPVNTFVEGNMKKSKFYVCADCGNVVISTGNAEVSSCGRKIPPLEMKKAEPERKLHVEQIEDEWYVTAPGRSMTKEEYISFVAFLTGDSAHIVKQYPEWDMQARFKKRGHGMLVWYSGTEGLMYQLV
ncbi:MAG: helix-turn-helix transcriptional regulator [Clostridia bacterium]|nr:helix-turn-helix transcriptional regulator [Clostridia bacterium]